MDGIRGELGAEFILQPGLFEGRAGILLASAALGGEMTGHHLRRLGWHALSFRGGTAFPGNGLVRLSMDLATGTAGVLLAVLRRRHRRARRAAAARCRPRRAHAPGGARRRAGKGRARNGGDHVTDILELQGMEPAQDGAGRWASTLSIFCADQT